MKANEIASTLSAFCLLASFPVLAQQIVMPPPAARAIDTHLQQSRTQKQREAMEDKRTASLPSHQTKNNQPGNQKVGAVTAKPKAVNKPPRTATTE